MTSTNKGKMFFHNPDNKDVIDGYREIVLIIDLWQIKNIEVVKGYQFIIIFVVSPPNFLRRPLYVHRLSNQVVLRRNL